MKDISKGKTKDVTYGQFVCMVRPERTETNRTRRVTGGNSINYLVELATPTAEMMVATILFNSVVSTIGT